MVQEWHISGTQKIHNNLYSSILHQLFLQSMEYTQVGYVLQPSLDVNKYEAKSHLCLHRSQAIHNLLQTKFR